MKNINLAGRLGKSAELRRTQNGDPVLSFSVAVDDGFGQDKKTLWFDCSIWGKRAEKLEQYLVKGTPVAVSGDLSTREHNGKTYLTVRVNEITMQGGKQEQPSAAPQPRSAERAMADVMDDEIPF